ncbi:MAG TPA: PadR family transcriptional regulator [Anaerolineales bacterium]|nr:PadR family transcriptional regulator [Anaerolineales bacterium]HRQ92695.1 PadR family transcriptional regulator [Anaerolineales bacterium]
MTTAELAILGLIAEAPRHGYEIEQVLEQRNMRRWADIGFSSIYYLLNKLESKGWISSQSQPAEGKGPARRVFSILPEGQQAWYAATLEALGGPGKLNSTFLTGLAGLPGLRPNDVVAALRQYRRSVFERKQEVDQAWQHASDLPFFLEGMFEYSANMLETELEWLDRYIPRFESQITEQDDDEE